MLPALSTNSPYLISVWSEVLCAPYPLVSILRSFPVRKSDGAPHVHGVKIDVVCDGGKRWIRINTIKNSRMLAELREIDSYMTDSEDESDKSIVVQRPSLAQKEFDNSILRMGRILLAAAKENPVPGTNHLPRVTLRLTRLDPSESGVDSRIAQTVRCLSEMGIDVELGERGNSGGITAPPTLAESIKIFEPTMRINLDLSTLIALVSDLTHAPLPQSSEEANARFIPSQKYLEWKQCRLNAVRKKQQESMDRNGTVSGKPGKNTLARALVAQVTQEMAKGLLQDMHDRLASILSPEIPNDTRNYFSKNVEFWTTPEAHDRCHRILTKIGGPNERRRANALFPTTSASIEVQEEAYWRDSRYPRGFLPLVPIHILRASESHRQQDYPPQPENVTALPPFFRLLASTCKNILAQEIVPHPRALPQYMPEDEMLNQTASNGEIQRAAVTKANPRLTAHTVQSLLWGAELGWTTLTANRSSVKAILRDMKQAGDFYGFGQEAIQGVEFGKAAVWLVDPRSLAEGQRADFEELFI